MPDVLFLSDRQVRSLIDIGGIDEALQEAFIAISDGRTDAPERIAAKTGAGMLLAMPGYVENVALVTKLVSLFPANAALGLPSHQGLLALFDPETGSPLAVMGAEYLTMTRTAVAAAVAADLLSRADSSILTILGAGAQARGHLDAFARIRPWSEIRIWNRTEARATRLAGEHDLAVVATSPSSAVAGADVVALCTHADAPLFEGDAAPGTHLSSVGIGNEIPDTIVAGARVVVEWRGAATAPPPAGAVDLATVGPDRVVEMGEILAGRAPGRQHPEQVTVYKSVGHAAEDAATARVVYDRAVARGIGTRISV